MVKQSVPTNIRLSLESFEKIEKIANDLHLPTRTLIRSWVMQRLDTEEKSE